MINLIPAVPHKGDSPVGAWWGARPGRARNSFRALRLLSRRLGPVPPRVLGSSTTSGGTGSSGRRAPHAAALRRWRTALIGRQGSPVSVGRRAPTGTAARHQVLNRPATGP
jgi:hypothetical protein